MLILVQLPSKQLMFSCMTLWSCEITRIKKLGTKDVFVGCSEISINVIVKHVQHVAIILACSLAWAELLSFSVPGEKEKNC